MKIEIGQREYDVLQCRLAGLSNKATAVKLGICTRTVKYHVEVLFRRLNVASTAELVALFGKMEVKLVWIANSDAPVLTVHDFAGGKKSRKRRPYFIRSTW